MKSHLLIVLCLLLHFGGMSQCKISASKTVCIGDPSYFSISLPTSSKLSSASWDFGDGFSTKVQNPGHLYNKPGVYKVVCTLKLAGGASCKDSVETEVLKLPEANFSFVQRDSCFIQNLVSVKNLSLAASLSQPLNSLLIIWDDGSIDKISSEISHRYTLPGNYKISLEVTDTKGCKHIKSDSVEIISSPIANFSVKKDINCGQTKICFNNTTETNGTAKHNYTWIFDNDAPIQINYKDERCFTFTRNKTLSSTLIVSNASGCSDTVTQKLNVKVDTISALNLILSDTSICYGSKITATIQPDNGYKYVWSIMDSNSSKIVIDSRMQDTLGRNLLKCSISNGICKVDIDTHFTIKGPKAKITIYNNEQCGFSDKVFFIDSSLVLDYKKSSRYWSLIDPNGDSCVCYRERNINKYKNCNYSKDWYHKHLYSAKEDSYPVLFNVYDSLTKCGDTILSSVNTNNCPDPCSIRIKGCQYWLVANQSSKYLNLIKFSLDSGQTWLKLPWKLPKGFRGNHSILLMYALDSTGFYDYGDDSIIFYKDTTITYTFAYIKDFPFGEGIPDSRFKYIMSKDCDFKDVFIKLTDSLFKYDEYVSISWGDGGVDTIRYNDYVNNDTIKHRYPYRYFNDTIIVSRKLANKCVSRDSLPIKYGFKLSIKTLKNSCLGDMVCYDFSVEDMGNSQQWNANNNYGTVKLFTGETKIIENSFKPCYHYQSNGKKTVMLVAASNEGCSDTLVSEFVITEIKSGVTNDSKNFGCGEIKQLFDSSFMLPISTQDNIKEYFWDFGNNTFLSTQKNPYHRFTKFGSYTVTHIVKSVNGCMDSVKFIVNVPGPQPSFDIKDTIACQPFTVWFKNNSKFCSQYYWMFGDPENNTMLDNSTNEISFTYTEPGKYYIKLTGIDSFYSNTTHSTYYCRDTFPKNLKDRSITVLPSNIADFKCEDTICINEKLSIENLSNKRFTTFTWDFGDGSTLTEPFNQFVHHTYKQLGNFKIVLIPDYNVSEGIPKCLDTAQKTIHVMGTIADFEYERICESPLLNFINTSQPENDTTRYSWDFGQPNFPNNITDEKNPKHDYGFNKGDFIICLSLIDKLGCRDSICKSILNEYTTQLILPNVFTPGFKDDKNDEYDIAIDGEEIYNLSIYNRWGQLMYHSKTDGQRGDGTNWNGRVLNQGNLCPEGTYFYIFEYKMCYGDTEQKRVSGTITLIR